eukprot:Phypoly_transcript_05280.p1 GENE.Phypoly_transcript_05280~~Phypoly_transcript_05280.p1  ORF type:complete len:606 (+),score=91.12 Phypoly_transcript_05280:87-1904(+)
MHKRSMVEDPTAYVLEKVSVDGDSDGEYKYEEVVIDSESDEEENDDLETILKSQKKPDAKRGATKEPTTQNPTFTRKQEVVDDFFRNFLVKSRFHRTLDVFQTEWYENVQKGKIKQDDPTLVPDVYTQNNELERQTYALKEEVAQWQALTGKLRDTIGKLKKDRDFHKMHHKRLTQEKNRLISDLKKLQKKVEENLSPELNTFKVKYENAYRELNLVKIERDRYAKKLSEYENGMRTAEPAQAVPAQRSKPPERTTREKASPTRRTEAAKAKKTGGAGAGGGQTHSEKDAEIPLEDRPNPFANFNPDAPELTRFISVKMQAAHTAPITSLAMHPTKSICVSTSDDATWKMWSLPDCQLIMSGEGHKDWVSDCDFNPKGNMLVTSSGDNTVKIWDFANSCCSLTFTDHSSSVWSCAFHDTGDFVASGSLDHTAKLFDLHSMRCRQTLRGHMDSVNSIEFLPYSNHLATCSGDKTVSLWDVRSGLCVQTFFGHGNSCNHVTFNSKGDTLASSDADGIVKLWDVRTVSEKLTIDLGPFPANHVSFDPSATYLVVPSDSHIVKVYNVVENKHVTDMRGHEDAVNAVVFDSFSRFLVSASSDGVMQIWTP